MTVMIGVDPHKRSHTAVAIDESEADRGKYRNEARIPDQREGRKLRRSARRIRSQLRVWEPAGVCPRESRAALSPWRRREVGRAT